MEEQSPVPPITQIETPKTNKGWKLATIITSVVALCGIGFGVYEMIQKDKTTSDLKVQIENKDGSVTELDTDKIKTTTEGGTTITISDAPTISEEEMAKYIYIAQWGIKIKIPDTLGGLTYAYRYDVLAINGTICDGSHACHYHPEFADIENYVGLGALTRYSKDDTMEYMCQPVTTIDNYVYCYSGPQAAFSLDDDEIQWEVDTANLIKQVLTDKNNYSKI